jgi:hypothetical protein
MYSNSRKGPLTVTSRTFMMFELIERGLWAANCQGHSSPGQAMDMPSGLLLFA